MIRRVVNQERAFLAWYCSPALRVGRWAWYNRYPLACIAAFCALLILIWRAP